MQKYNAIILKVLFAFMLALLACDKLIEIPPPINAITTNEAYGDSATASAALNGLYSAASERVDGLLGSGNLSATTGLYCDELRSDDNNENVSDFFFANIRPGSTMMRQYYWSYFYSVIYQCNSIIQNLSTNDRISSTVRIQFVNEAKFFRAYCYFLLIELFGDVPIVKSTEYKNNVLLPRESTAKVSDFIIADLKDAKNELRKDYQVSKNERVRVNSYSAAALLAKVYLYLEKYNEALVETNYVIEATTLYKLENDINKVFNRNSPEAILQFSCNPDFYPYNATGDGTRFVQYKGAPPRYYFSLEFMSIIDPNDKRRTWIDSTEDAGTWYYYPYKYIIGDPQLEPGTPATQYTTILRLSDILLIRAECYIRSTQITKGLEDINQIRNRAGLSEATAVDEGNAMKILETERRIELFCENGNRWFDLKRWKKADEINSKIKSGWAPYKKLFPIPQYEIESNTAITQNPGYAN